MGPRVPPTFLAFSIVLSGIALAVGGFVVVQRLTGLDTGLLLGIEAAVGLLLMVPLSVWLYRRGREMERLLKERGLKNEWAQRTLDEAAGKRPVDEPPLYAHPAPLVWIVFALLLVAAGVLLALGQCESSHR